MENPKLIHHKTNYWTVLINPNLVQTRKERKFKGAKGVTAQFGLNPYGDEDIEKLMYIDYPTDVYSREYMKESIIPQYDDCPLCKIGREKKKIVDLDNKNSNNLIIGGTIISFIIFGGFLFKGLIFRKNE